MFKVGDLITLDRISYPQYEGYLGLIVDDDAASNWYPPDHPASPSGRTPDWDTRAYQVLIAGCLHPFRIYPEYMINETEDEA
jgi:hypothetical protein